MSPDGLVDRIALGARAAERARPGLTDARVPFAARWACLAEAGVMALRFPPAAGGTGAGAAGLAHALASLGRDTTDRGLLVAVVAHSLACGSALVRFGTTPVLARWAERVVAGTCVAAFAVTEPGSGSDAYALACRAVRDGDGYRLDGDKVHVVSAARADVYVVLARTAPDAGILGLSAFAIPRDRAGLSTRAVAHRGLVGAEMGSIALRACPAREDERIGADGVGGRLFEVALAEERAVILAPLVGAMEAQLVRTAARCATAIRGGKPIAEHSAAGARLGAMAQRATAARAWLERAARALDDPASAKDELRAASAMAKVAMSEAIRDNAQDAARLAGAAGLEVDGPCAVELDDAQTAGLISGPDDVLRELVARDLVGRLERQRS